MTPYAHHVPSPRPQNSVSSAQDDTANPAELSFEAAMDELEAIVQRIERGEIGLEESLAQYERGVKLINRCKEVLSMAEQRVEELSPISTSPSA